MAEISGHKETFSIERREEALNLVDSYLKELPQNKALAIRRGIHFLKQHATNYSLIDLWDPAKSRLESRILKEQSPSDVLRQRLRAQENLGEEDVIPPSQARGFESLTSQKVLELGENFSSGFSLREIANLFDPLLGILKVPASLKLNQSRFAGFYEQGRKIGDLSSLVGEVELSGERSHVADWKKVRFEDRLETIEEDVVDCLSYLNDVYENRSIINNPRDYLMFLGVLNLLKIHSLTLFHLSTYEERDFEIPVKDRESYFDRKMLAMSLAEDSVRFYYQTLLGFDYQGGLEISKIRSNAEMLIDGLKEHMTDFANSVSKPIRSGRGDVFSEEFIKYQKYKFKTPEVENPLVIALGIQEAVRHNPDVDIVVGIPTGGTEIAIVTQFFYEVLKGKPPAVFFLPISVHSEEHVSDVDAVSAYLSRYFNRVFKDKEVLAVDDNAASGMTLSIAAEALVRNGASHVSVHVAEVDLRNFLAQSDLPIAGYFNPNVTKGSSLGTTTISREGRYEKKKVIRERLRRSRES